MGRVSHTPNDEYILILNADAEENDIGIAGLGINFEAINITQQGDNALITINSIDLAILQDINIATLSSDDFVFI